ncbi:hypothetical protein Poli38472_010544 [Pythium oligandrum]|uniref:Uncharacterized protein n=1 Tax=Pythium oligandrum TaxID=41045 RepID=A0A8K1C3W2_PYTOL|nr:hypothetical protein Poli38472_010544 [Pythium oligandrum]|eukprot:TMW55662.1 hypothetical protein Poli38472_010544 [Pythium oligandrum]
MLERHDVDILAMLLAEEDAEFAQETESRSEAKVKVRDLNSSRQRQREELQYLRRRVTELESELAAQKQMHRSSDGTLRVDPDASPTTVGGDGALTTGVSEWEAIALRQKKTRQRAELENHKLRQMVESQVRVAKTLEKLLLKRPNALHVDPSELKRRRRFYQMTSDRDEDAGIFENILASIDRSYAETSVVLEGNGLMRAPVGHRSVDIKAMQGNTSGMTDVYVELTDVSTMPFSQEATASAMWRCITSGYMQLHHEIYKAYAGSEDILAIKYTITLTRRRLAVDFVARAAMKRFVEGDRVVDVWECLSDTEETRSGSNAPGIQVRERGWTVLHPINGGASTKILSCMQMHPLVIENNADEERRVGVLTNLALDYYGEQIDQAHHAIESLLLDETRSTVAISSLVDDI